MRKDNRKSNHHDTDWRKRKDCTYYGRNQHEGSGARGQTQSQDDTSKNMNDSIRTKSDPLQQRQTPTGANPVKKNIEGKRSLKELAAVISNGRNDGIRNSNEPRKRRRLLISLTDKNSIAKFLKSDYPCNMEPKRSSNREAQNQSSRSHLSEKNPKQPKTATEDKSQVANTGSECRAAPTKKYGLQRSSNFVNKSYAVKNKTNDGKNNTSTENVSTKLGVEQKESKCVQQKISNTAKPAFKIINNRSILAGVNDHVQDPSRTRKAKLSFLDRNCHLQQIPDRKVAKVSLKDLNRHLQGSAEGKSEQLKQTRQSDSNMSRSNTVNGNATSDIKPLKECLEKEPNRFGTVALYGLNPPHQTLKIVMKNLPTNHTEAPFAKPQKWKSSNVASGSIYEVSNGKADVNKGNEVPLERSNSTSSQNSKLSETNQPMNIRKEQSNIDEAKNVIPEPRDNHQQLSLMSTGGIQSSNVKSFKSCNKVELKGDPNAYKSIRLNLSASVKQDLSSSKKPFIDSKEGGIPQNSFQSTTADIVSTSLCAHIPDMISSNSRTNKTRKVSDTCEQLGPSVGAILPRNDDLYDDLDKPKVLLDEVDDLDITKEENQEVLHYDNESHKDIITITPTKYPASSVKRNPKFFSPHSDRDATCEGPCAIDFDLVPGHLGATLPTETKKEVKMISEKYSFPEYRKKKTNDNSLQEFQQVIIPPDLCASKLMCKYEYISFTKPVCGEDKEIASFGANDIKTQDGHIEPNSLSVTILHMLLDSIGFMFSKKSQSQESLSICQIPKEKKPSQTPSSVRDFIIEVIDQMKDPSIANSFLRFTAFSFRLACHFLLLACEPSKDIDRQTKQQKSKHKKRSELLKRSLLTLIICLRGLFARLMERIQSTEEKDILDIKSYFICNQSFSEAQCLLLDIISLLTDLNRKHGTLGSKKSIALLKHLVKLEKAFISLIKDDPKCNPEMELIHGMMEMFMRQLLHQEGNESGLMKELQHCQSKFSSKGIMACTHVSMTTQCRTTIDRILALRNISLQRIKSATPSQQDQKNVVKVTPATASSTSESNYLEDSLWYDQKIETGKLKYDELRIDGCIYISQILDVLQSMPTTNIATKEEAEKETKRMKLSRTVYFLFHILWENDPFPGDPFHAKSLQKRENMKSAALACFILAGKVLDQPVSMKRLLLLADKATFPVSLPLLNTSMYMKSGENGGCKAEQHFGEPSKTLIKEYEAHLLLIGFGFNAPLYEDIYVADKILLEADIGEGRLSQCKRIFDHPAFTHSQLSLIEDNKTVGYALYLFNCELNGESPSISLQGLYSEERGDAELLCSYMSDIFSYVRERRNKILNMTVPPVKISMVLVPPDFKSVLNEAVI